MSTAKTAWMARLGMRHPIIQAPMAGTSTPALAAAVTEAGGLGSLGIGASGTEQARQQIVQTRAGATIGDLFYMIRTVSMVFDNMRMFATTGTLPRDACRIDSS